jgi:hypothetical protein
MVDIVEPKYDLLIEKFEVNERSSTINTVEYDTLMENMNVIFKNGVVYTFCGVPKTCFEEFKNAESYGRYFHSNVKNKYEFMKK